MPQDQHPVGSESHAMLAEARERLEKGDVRGAKSAIDAILAAGFCPAGIYYLKSQCLDRENVPFESLQAVEAELVLNPSYPGAAEHRKRLADRLSVPGSDLPSQRPWSTGLDQNSIRHFEHCSHRYTYRSIPMSKNAFDLAIYPLLMWDTKPKTIIEVGSFYGGSAVWMADQTQSWGLDTRIYSVDVNKVYTAQHDRVSFIQGNGRDLGSVFSKEFLAGLPRPLLVIEDADHSYITTRAVLDFFHPLLNDGEYLIVEDVMTAPTEAGRALREFLATHSNDYLVDRRYCDFFGTNVTWCINGYLRKIGAGIA